MPDPLQGVQTECEKKCEKIDSDHDLAKNSQKTKILWIFLQQNVNNV